MTVRRSRGSVSSGAAPTAVARRPTISASSIMPRTKRTGVTPWANGVARSRARSSTPWRHPGRAHPERGRLRRPRSLLLVAHLRDEIVLEQWHAEPAPRELAAQRLDEQAAARTTARQHDLPVDPRAADGLRRQPGNGEGSPHEADAVLEELTDELRDPAGAERTPEVPRVLVEQAMRDERDTAAALIAQPRLKLAERHGHDAPLAGAAVGKTGTSSWPLGMGPTLLPALDPGIGRNRQSATGELPSTPGALAVRRGGIRDFHRRAAADTDEPPAVRGDPRWVTTSSASRARISLRTVARRVVESRAEILAGVAVVAIAAGFVLHLAGAPAAGHQVWRAAVALLAVELAFEVGRTVIVDHHLGVDTIALVAMVGALALGEELAGAVIGLMFTGGAALETVASRRARRELTQLVQRAPRVAQLRVDGGIDEVPVDRVQPGDVVLVRAGEVVPVDGTVVSEEAVVDTSTLTGEPLPVTLRTGMAAMSGTANAGAPFDVRADRPAAESAYAALVRLLEEQAQAQRAPFVRMADRYAGIFLPVTLVVASLAWALSGDPVRGLAVVVVATPCPLILAAPIALVSGLSRAARSGIIVKGAGAIELLGEARTVLFDKTGTLTVGTPEVREVVTLDGLAVGEVLRLAASVDRMSAHVLGEALVRAARESALDLGLPSDVAEEPGQGIVGTLDGHRVVVGSRAFLRSQGYDSDAVVGASLAVGRGSGEAHVLVGVDGHPAGVIVMADELRPDADRIVDRLRAERVRHVAMVSGDRRSAAERIGAVIGVDRVYADQSPEDKLEVVRALRDDPKLSPVIMVGDGVNDAPALALADVGIAMGAAGATVSSETADAVITVDRVDRVADAVHIGRRALSIARQSVLAGMGLQHRRHGRRRRRLPAAGRRRPVPGGHRPRRDPQCPARPQWVSPLTGRGAALAPGARAAAATPRQIDSRLAVLSRYAAAPASRPAATSGSSSNAETDTKTIDEPVEGSARDALVASVECRGPAVIAVGGRGFGGFHGQVLGGTGRWLANLAPCPVLVSRSPP